MNRFDVLGYIKIHCRGVAKAQTKARIALEVYGDVKYARQVEDDIDFLIKNQYEFICSSCQGQHLGFFHAETSAEIECYLKQLESREGKLSDRIIVVRFLLGRMKEFERIKIQKSEPKQAELPLTC